MKNHRLGTIAFVIVLLTWHGTLSRSSGDERKAEAKESNPAVPADLKDWTIRFDGFAGTPGDRSWFRVSLKHDGTINVQKKRIFKGGYRTVLDKKLDEAETRHFYDTAVGIINDYRKDKSTGDTHDGWNLTLEISAESFKRAVKYQDQWDPVEGPPGFEILSKIINRHLKEEKFPE